MFKFIASENDIGISDTYIQMIVRGKDGSLTQVNRLECTNDDEYYANVAKGKDVSIEHTDHGKVQFDDIFRKISSNGHTENDVSRNKNSLGK